MTGAELEARGIKLFGKKHWEKILADKIGIHFTTVWRWRRSARPVPVYVAAVLEAEEQKRKLERITTSLSKQLR